MKFNFNKSKRYLLLPLVLLFALPLQAVESVNDAAEGEPVMQSTSEKIAYFQDRKADALAAGNTATAAYCDQIITLLMGEQ